MDWNFVSSSQAKIDRARQAWKDQVFPKIPGLFIVVPVYMAAEKASDDILADAKAVSATAR